MTCNMPYTKQIKWRIRLLWAALIGMLIFMVVIGELGRRDSRIITGFAYNMSNMMFWGGMAYIISRMVINRRLLKDRIRLKEQQLRERDERNRYLHRMSGGWVMDAMLTLCYIAAVAASCWSNATFYVAFGLLAGAVLLKAGAYTAYDKGWLQA